MRVLVVEDNALLRHHLKVQIQDAGHQVDDAEDAKEADYYLNEHLPDIAIVDLGLPDEDGLSLIRRWRSNDVSLPILVLTARESWQDKVEVLSAGADDYVTKPFHIEEVMARMQALMRRNSGLASQVISLPPFQVDLSRRELSINDEVIKLNRPGFPGECFICELRLPDHRFRWKHNKLFLLLPEEYGPAFPAIVDCYTSPPT